MHGGYLTVRAKGVVGPCVGAIVLAANYYIVAQAQTSLVVAEGVAAQLGTGHGTLLESDAFLEASCGIAGYPKLRAVEYFNAYALIIGIRYRVVVNVVATDGCVFISSAVYGCGF